MRSQAQESRSLEQSVWSQPGLSSDLTDRRMKARHSNALFLERLEAAFNMLARQHGIEYIDARELAMDGRVSS